jgi:c-di-GMP-binding flagellar brake protein YcgR
MGATQMLAGHLHEQVLSESARLKRRAVLTHQDASGWRLIKAVFTDSPAGRIALRLPPCTESSDVARLRAGTSLGVTFRLGHKKCLFATVIESTEPSDEGVILCVRQPEQLQQLQRRAYERVAPPPGSVIAVRFWRDDSGSDGTSPAEASRNVRHGQLEDISAGGMRIKAAEPQNMELEKTYRCVFSTGPGKPAFVLEALLRHREAIDHGRASLGFQFVGLETTTEGRKVLDRLARLVNHFHRSRQNRRRPNDRHQTPNAE